MGQKQEMGQRQELRCSRGYGRMAAPTAKVGLGVVMVASPTAGSMAL